MTSVSSARGGGHSRRRAHIVELVTAQGSMRIDALADRFGVSTMTIHRDLDHLDRRGLLRKVRSGAESPPSEAYERDLQLRRTLNVAEKQAVARAGLAWAAERVDLRAVALDDSTTALHVLPLLQQVRPLTVVTNFVPAITALAAAEPAVRLHAVGGDFVPEFSSFVGSATVRALAGVHVDVVFLSVPAVARGACFHPSSEAADVKRAFLAGAELRVLLVDHTKFARRAVHRIAPLTDFDVVVVDEGLRLEDRDALRAQDVDVVVAPLEPTAAGWGDPPARGDGS